MKNRDRGSRGTGRIELLLALALLALSSGGARNAGRLARILPEAAQAQTAEVLIAPSVMGSESLRSRRDFDLAAPYHYLRADDIDYRGLQVEPAPELQRGAAQSVAGRRLRLRQCHRRCLRKSWRSKLFRSGRITRERSSLVWAFHLAG